MQPSYYNALVESSSVSLSLPPSNDNDSISTDADDSDINDDAQHTSTPSNTSGELIVKKTKPRKDNPNDNVRILPSGINFSAMFITRQNDLIQKCQDKQAELRVDEELSINGIIILNDDLASNIVNENIYTKKRAV